MTKQTGAIVVAMLLAVGTAGVSYAADASAPQGPFFKKGLEGANAIPAGALLPKMVTGELQKVEGNYYTVKDQSGKVVNFQIDDARTMMHTHPVVGDRIVAEIEPQGYAFSISAAPLRESSKENLSVRQVNEVTVASSSSPGTVPGESMPITIRCRGFCVPCRSGLRGQEV